MAQGPPRSSSHQRPSPTPAPTVAVSSEVPKFDVVAAITPVGTAPCAECRGAIVDTYYESAQGIICASCHRNLASSPPGSTATDRITRAVVYGTIAASLAAAGYFALLLLVGREVSVALVAVGFGVGKAVRLGARGRGGRRLQWLALLLTYLAIVATYIPFVLKGAATDDMGALLLLAVAAPILEGLDHGLTLIMIALALGQAWRSNRHADLRMTGPYVVRAAQA